MTYSKEDVKEFLDLDDIYNLLEYLDAEPQMYNNYIISRTICHNGDSHKLYYYDNTSLFKCFTGECGSFDVFELVQKVQDIDDLNKAIFFVVNFFNLQSQLSEVDEDFSLEDWKRFNRYHAILDIEINEQEELHLPQIDNLIEYYPQPRLLSWEREHISDEVIKYMGIKYDPVNGAILIPHTDQNGRLVGIRQRTLVEEDEKYGKYKPARLNGQLCNHPLAFNLYGLEQAKNNIQESGLAVVAESEKAVLQFISYFGLKGDLCVAVCGSSLSKYQFNLLRDCGAKEIVIAFDRDFEDYMTDECDQVKNKLTKIHYKYATSAKISFCYDYLNLLDYKDSPMDKGKEVFLELFRNRVVL